MDAVDGFGVDALPFMFSSWDEINYVLNDTEFGEAMNQKLIDAGARILVYVPCGSRQMIFPDMRVFWTQGKLAEKAARRSKTGIEVCLGRQVGAYCPGNSSGRNHERLLYRH